MLSSLVFSYVVASGRFKTRVWKPYSVFRDTLDNAMITTLFRWMDSWVILFCNTPRDLFKSLLVYIYFVIKAN